MSVSIFHLYTDIHLDAGLPTPTPERLALDPKFGHLRTLEGTIKRRYPGHSVRFAEFPAIITGNNWTLIGLVHDPDKDAPYINLWSPVRLDQPQAYGAVSLVVSDAGTTFILGDDALNTAIAQHVRWTLDGGKAPSPGFISGRGPVPAREVL